MALSKSLDNARQKQHTIVKAAQELFLENGYGDTSMDLVASRAGVTKQTVYRYYPSKEALFSAVMASIRNDEPAIYTMGDGNTETELCRFGCSLLAFHLSPAALGVYRLMVCEGGKENLRDIFMKAGPNRVMKPLYEFFQRRFSSLNEVEFYAQMFVTLLLAPRNQLLMQSKQRFNRAEQTAHVNRTVKLFLHGIETHL